MPLVKQVMKFLQTAGAPVSPEEAIELFASMEAAAESKRRGGALVKTKEFIQ